MEDLYIAVIILLVAVLIIICWVTLNAIKSVKSILVSVKRYAKGDFSKTISVKGNKKILDLAGSLNEMASLISEQDTLKKNLVANISHEFKTPLTSISGFVDGILDGTIHGNEQNKYLNIVSQETKRLSRLVNSTLNLSKIESGQTKMNKSYFNIMESTLTCLLTFEKQISSKQIEIKGLDKEKKLVYADNDLIYQVIYNLIENAIKFVNEKGYIEFSSYVKDDMFYYSVKNSGEGLEDSEMSLVFNRFYKTDNSRSSDKTGVGLGLYLASLIINMHKGNIIVRSIKGKYTEFIFAIPNDSNKDKGKRIEDGLLQ